MIHNSQPPVAMMPACESVGLMSKLTLFLVQCQVLYFKVLDLLSVAKPWRSKLLKVLVWGSVRSGSS